MKTLTATVLLTAFFHLHGFCTTIEDHSHYSKVLGSNRNYRVFLPPGYYSTGKRYPVIYWFHGSGGSATQATYKAEFESFINHHDLIIVNVDGTTESGTTWDYGLAFEYDTRTQEGKTAMSGMHFSNYIRELIEVIDSCYRTIADRDHRATSGQSMGGLMSPWIASQNKDLIGSASLFSPSPDAAMFGPVSKEVCFVNRELYRSLKGLPLRLTYAGGDRYRQYYREQIAIWELADLTHFEYHEVDYPDHKAVGIPEQFEFHMTEFAKSHPIPQNWHHADPFTKFTAWNYEVNVNREMPAFTVLEKVTASGMLISSRPFLPDGPLIGKEKITVSTDALYSPLENYVLTDFNRSNKEIKTSALQADDRGRLQFSLEGGGHAIGIKTPNGGPKLFLIPAYNREELYCEEGQEHSLGFSLVNVGTGASGPVVIRAGSPKSTVDFREETLTLGSIGPGQRVELKNQFPFVIRSIFAGSEDNTDFVTGIYLEVICKDSVQDVQRIFVYPVIKTPFIALASDLLILDGSSKPVEVYDNLTHEIKVQTLSGGNGNGNSIPEPGETIELFVRLPQGMGPRDQNTHHPAYLMNRDENPWVTVEQVKYNLKGSEYSGAANIQSMIRIRPDTPPGTELSLWLKCESYEFSEEGFNRPIQRHHFDYRRVILKVGLP